MHFGLDFRMWYACMKTAKNDDATTVLLDFSKSGASDFDDFRSLVSYHFPQLFFKQF